MSFLKSLVIAAGIACLATGAFAVDKRGNTCVDCTQIQRVAGKFQVAQSGNCCARCSAGTTCTNCRSNETCSSECRSSGQPGVSCHPR